MNNNNSDSSKTSNTHELSDVLSSALRSGIGKLKETLTQRKLEVLSNYRALHVALTKYLEALKEQEEAGTFFRAPNYGKFMGNYQPQDIATIIITKQNSKSAKTRIAVATVDDQIIPDSELGNIPLNQLLMYALFVQDRLEFMMGRRMYRAAYLQEFLDQQDIEFNPRPWLNKPKRFSGGNKRQGK